MIRFSDHDSTQLLKGISVLVTRPKIQSENLAVLIRHHGGEAIIFPTIEIKPIKISKALISTLKNLDQFKFAIFTSYYAVYNSIPMVKRYWDALPNTLVIIAIGAKTAKALSAFGIKVNLYPQNDFSSEALLQLPLLRTLNGKKIILFRGQDGRGLLKKRLVERGASLTEFICYQRLIPQPHPKDWEKIAHHKIDVIICTSVESLNNLFQLMTKQKTQTLNQQWSQNAHWLFISERIKNAALNFGIKPKPMIANKSSNEEIVNTLIQFAKDKNEKNRKLQ